MTAKDGGRATGPAPPGPGGARPQGSAEAAQATMTAKERYDAKTAVYVSLKLNRGTDSDVLRRLEAVPSKQGYIKELIRADIAKDK